ncbi:hypothetical protein T265_12098 [Opisthorchis viverrini]|uniref:Uncharacterized protein n=1 Tax=Opisthorchis viverrini TaxID=6198 RepID=A0A074YW58_OPIVI|nr:hypothetical protein T265_12098 [Opisthorchis viverrini]KER18918.1 hypothetical protein T265_12098 [Opisthorchis viverrini]
MKKELSNQETSTKSTAFRIKFTNSQALTMLVIQVDFDSTGLCCDNKLAGVEYLFIASALCAAGASSAQQYLGRQLTKTVEQLALRPGDPASF